MLYNLGSAKSNNGPPKRIGLSEDPTWGGGQMFYGDKKWTPGLARLSNSGVEYHVLQVVPEFF